MTVLYPNPCYNEVCYKRTVLYREEHEMMSLDTDLSYIVKLVWYCYQVNSMIS